MSGSLWQPATMPVAPMAIKTAMARMLARPYCQTAPVIRQPLGLTVARF
jgi:hypothetical protein